MNFADYTIIFPGVDVCHRFYFLQVGWQLRRLLCGREKFDAVCIGRRIGGNKYQPLQIYWPTAIAGRVRHTDYLADLDRKYGHGIFRPVHHPDLSTVEDMHYFLIPGAEIQQKRPNACGADLGDPALVSAFWLFFILRSPLRRLSPALSRSPV